jgi:hypothetical protein
LEGGNRGGGEECGEKLKTGGREVVIWVRWREKLYGRGGDDAG